MSVKAKENGGITIVDRGILPRFILKNACSLEAFIWMNEHIQFCIITDILLWHLQYLLPFKRSVEFPRFFLYSFSVETKTSFVFSLRKPVSHVFISKGNCLGYLKYFRRKKKSFHRKIIDFMLLCKLSFIFKFYKICIILVYLNLYNQKNNSIYTD